MAGMMGMRPVHAPQQQAPEAQKKGEVNELRTLLRSVNTGNDNKKKRDVIRKVIAYMTLGIDVSRLFADMILACNTRDLVVKKMVYLYLCAYAQTNPELTLLAINTLQKDCRDEDPMVRGLALRSLTGLRLLSVLEYVMTPLKAALSDASGYVRQAGVIGLLKVYHVSPSLIREGDFVDTLYNMLRDRDPQVVINCITTLNEILADEGGIALNQPMMHYLLGRLKEYSDWGQCVIMELVARYRPESEDELFGIMNLLDPCLKVANSAVVLSATKAFLALTAALPEIQRQVYIRLKTPFLTLLATASNEAVYSLLHHLSLCVDRCPGIFDDDYKQLFCRYNEPTSNKALRMVILPKLANTSNARDICTELQEYVHGGSDTDLARQAVRAVGEIAVRVPQAVDAVTEALLELVQTDADYVRAETIVVLRDLLRKYPHHAPAIIPSLHHCLRRVEDPSGKAAAVWMLGEYGHLIDDAPYVLEPIIDHFREEESVSVRLEVLAATVKLFFKRPPEVQHMMGRLFKTCLDASATASNSVSVLSLGDGQSNSTGGGGLAGSAYHPAVHDRALLYYRLLRTDIAAAEAVIAGDGPRAPVAAFDDELSDEVKERVWKEFNTLSIMYGMPADSFIAPDHLTVRPEGPAGQPQPAAAAGGADDTLLSSADPVNTSSGDVDLLGDDLLGLGLGAASSSAASTSFMAPAGASSSSMAGGFGGLDMLGLGSSAPAAPAVSLQPGATLDPNTFQSKWGALPVAQSVNMRAGRLAAPAELDAILRNANFFSIAQGDIGTAIKMFFFARDNQGGFHLFEMVFEKASLAVVVTAKADNASLAQPVVGLLQQALRSIPIQ